MDTGEKIKVLIVEDDQDAATLMGTVLAQELPADISVAADGVSAREKMSGEDFDVVTLDYWLPDESGLDLLEDITEGEDSPPVVVVTACDQAHLAARSFELGAAGYVVKDYKLPDSLADAVKDALAKAALDRARKEGDMERAFTNIAVNEMAEIFFVLDLEGRLTSWNKKLKDIAGLEDRELHLARVSSIFNGRDAWLLNERSFPARGEDKVTLHLGLVTMDGRRVPYEFICVMLTDRFGKPVGICGLGKEGRHGGSTDWTSAESEVADLTVDIIFRIDTSGTIRDANEEARRFWSARGDELIGTSALELIDKDDVEKIKRAATRAISDGKQRITGIVTHLKTPSGWRYVEWNAAPVLEDGQLTGFQVTGRDITEHELTDRFLRHVNLELDEYAHTVSHDLRGPLSCIMLAADTLRLLLDDGTAKEKEEMVDEMARIISENSEQAGSLVKSMLDLAERAQMPKDVSEVDITEVINKALETLSPLLAEKGVTVRYSEDMGKVVANRTQIYQIFSNLISNAARHIAGVEKPVLDLVALGEDEGCHRYLARDNGLGFPEDQLETVFKPFVKSPDSEGRGIGLATVEKLVKSYGGNVRAYNDEGACIEFCLRDFLEREGEEVT